ncbi:MAG: dNTP triphosphohydrolase [Bacteroidaceae bacterium]|nr:dNTP triphosphohydrolase [Bacteroidaceae bacterium]
MNWQQLISNKRLGQEDMHVNRMDDRTEFRRDYDRLIFSAPFRRLQNKTQVFPLPGSVFVHNRLTHSLEVASVGRSLGDDVAHALIERQPALANTHILEIGSIVSAACLAHDLGNPPFGHSGERAIASYFLEDQGIQYKNQLTPEQWADITHFDGNANAFRLLTHQFKGRRAGGFVLTYSTLSSIVKYPYPATEALKQKFGYFTQEKEIYDRIATELGLGRRGEGWFRHPLAYLVEAADDICYEIMDIEDAHKLKILSFEETRDLMLGFLTEERRAHIIDRSQGVDDKNENVVYFRSCAIGALEQECVRVFVENEEAILNGSFEGSLIDHACPLIHDAYQACVKVAKSRIYRSRDVVDTELAGYKIIYTLIQLFTNAVMNPHHAYSSLLLDRVSSQYEVDSPDTYVRIMAVLDYLSGMTDVFALDLYRKINGESLPMI